MTYDILIKDATLVDGTGSPWFRADLATKGNKIAKIGKINDDSERTLSCSGLAVSPGWVDIHVHADHTILGNPEGLSYTHQGITTVTMGNCGLSMYPLSDEHRGDLVEYMRPFTSGLEVDYNWADLEGFVREIKRSGTSLNLVPLVGHGSVRVAVMGFEDKVPSRDELEAMKKHLRMALRQGSFGMSTGLGYPPGLYTSEAELLELGKVLREFGGIYTTHMRGEATNLEDTILLGLEMGVPIQVSHIGSSCGSIKQLVGIHEETTLRHLDKARARGLDITADIYPYTAGSSLLSQIIPNWLHADGVPRMIEKLNDPEVRAKIAAEYEERGRDWNRVIVSYVKSPKNKDIEGMSIADIAEKRGHDIVDAVCKIMIEERGEAMNISFWGVEEDVDTMVKHPSVMPCSDGWVLAPAGPLGEGKPHPRCYGAFPRYIHQYVKTKEILRLEDAVRRMTSLPASRLGLQDRGLLREGLKADITVFDVNKIRDLSTYQDPHRYPDGVKYVIINGDITIENGEHTGRLSGEVLLRQ